VLGEMSHSTIRTRVVESRVEGSSVALALWIERGGVVVVEVDGMISFGGGVEDERGSGVLELRRKNGKVGEMWGEVCENYRPEGLVLTTERL